MISGLLAGSLTSTPAFSATKEAVAAQYQDAVTVGYGIAYLFGVIGVVLFVQLMPRVVHADLDEERRKITHVETGDVAKFKGKLLEFDDFGFTPFAIAAVFGILLGSVKFFNFFSLTTTGGALLVSLVFGHFGHFGRADLMPSKKVLETFRELGLMVFLIGAGVSGGMSFVRYFKPIYFVYGIFMTLLPMIVGYVVAKHVLKMNLLNILGSITGGMTSTPALGTLIHVAGYEQRRLRLRRDLPHRADRGGAGLTADRPAVLSLRLQKALPMHLQRSALVYSAFTGADRLFPSHRAATGGCGRHGR